MVDQDWAGVRKRIVGLSMLPASQKVFGSLGHRWRLEDPLGEGDIVELESQIGVRLPSEYRDFLAMVAAGGAGPSYGVFPVRRVQGRWRWEGDGADLADLSRLADPFPDNGPDPQVLERLLAERPEEEDFEEIENFDTAIDAWDKRWESVMFAPERTTGAIVLCHHGCAQRDWLVLSGSHRGTMWSDPRADDADLEPLADAEGKPLTFSRWFTDWLDKAEHDARRPSVGS
ncbi:SMI1/KNR4 family protein [Streptomyces sp. SID2563]|uniref:SMI1/KNR4 family protein n=1 Tax=Streptomyces sp. SID2563 TaxID=2690255 RepID=UPI00136E69A5|nr:SMI1/KNR4 family protein [Streptomyces sp. SID2563]MYW11919.1 SMI1/KNR4 family protein [Streptomyces sp. SID2563]